MQLLDSNNSKSAILRILFFTLLAGLAIVYLVFTFRGLTSEYGMDQAQIGRQIAKGQGITTKFIRPVALQQLQESNKTVNMYEFHDTTHSPLNVLVYAGVIKAFGGDDPTKFAMKKNQQIYELDRIIAGTCVLFLILSIAFNYLLICKIFDSRIASIVALLMLVSEHFWNYSQSGLPQMLMLFIFSGACYLIWNAIQRQEAGVSPIVPIILSGFMFGLLALAHWMTLWIFFGYILFCITYFKPRGASAIVATIIVALFIAGPLIYNAQHSDGLMGTAYYYINGRTGIGQEISFRELSLPAMNVRELIIRVAKTTLLQTNQIHTHLGGFFMATGFFLALFHPFKRDGINSFKWAILTMWITSAIGMSIYGLSNSPIDPNQMHILFMPMMSAFALALISILWARVPLSQTPGLPSLTPFIAITLITAIPLIINVQNALRNSDNKQVPGQNPYIHNQVLTKYLKETDIVFSDQPWAVAWYADRTAIWIPKGTKYLEKIETMAKQSGSNVAGIYLTPSVTTDGFHYQQYGDLAPLALNLLSLPTGQGYAEFSPTTAALVSPSNGRYNYRVPMSENKNNSLSYKSYILYTNINPVERLKETEESSN